MDAILGRRSVRSFTDEPVTDEMVDKLLRAAMAAPSAGNQQPWHFVVLRDGQVRREVADLHTHAKMLPQAPVGIMVCGDLGLERYRGFWVQDCSAATQNMLLEAHELGLGGVWLGVHPVQERVRSIQKLLGLPDNVIPFSIIAVGHPAEQKGPEDRYHADRVHMDRW